jgi:hypothetical protein
MKPALHLAVALLVWGVVAPPNTPGMPGEPGYFASRSLSPHSPHADESRGRWFAGILRSFGEVPLGADAKRPRDLTTYRLLAMPAFSTTTMVRVDHSEANGALLTWKERDIAEDPQKSPVRVRSRPLTKTEWNAVEGVVRRASFWSLPPDIFDQGLDGVQLVLEGSGPGGYHVVHRWSPKDGTFRRLCHHLLRLAKPRSAAAPEVVDPRQGGPDRRARITGEAFQLPSGERAAGVTILLDGGGIAESRGTDAKGRFTFDDLLPGLYQLQFQSFLAGAEDGEPGFAMPGDRDTLIRVRPGEKACVRVSFDTRPKAHTDEEPRKPTVRVGCPTP